MAVRFKFRSSVDFDSVNIDGRPSIPLRDLKSKIVEQKNLKICQDFVLFVSDAATGEEYDDENFLIPSGSSVIIKRVPAGRSAHSALPCIDAVDNFGIKDANFTHTVGSSPSGNPDMENFDDFGIDLCPVPEAALSNSDSDKMNFISSEKADNPVLRCSEPSLLRCQNLEPSDLSEAIPRGAIHCGVEGNTSQTKLKCKMEEHKKFVEVINVSSLAMQNTDLPSELRCSLCNMIFKEAVMIPCCQHSFCGKCIRLLLVEKARCPKCSSTKCRAEDLLPNISLRQAIERFLESQILISGSDNIIPKDAPDEESGIQVKDASCAVSVLKREPELAHSPCATGKGSNQVMMECAYESLIKNNASAGGISSRIVHLSANESVKSAPLSHKIKQINREGDEATCSSNVKSGPEGLKAVVDFQGESQLLKVPQVLTQNEEANSTCKKKKGLWVKTAGGNGNFMVESRHRKGDRTCYMCGSPDHFVRDCPIASSPYHMLHTCDTAFQGGVPAYGPSYWHGVPLPHVRPFANVYGTTGVMPFDTTMVPVTPFAIPSYMPSIYSGLPIPSGLMRMRGPVPPLVSGGERLLSRAEFMELQDCEQRCKLVNEHSQREQFCDDDDLDECYRYNEPDRRSRDWKPQLDRENNGSYSEDADTRRLQRKHSHDKLPDEDIHFVDRRHEKGPRSSLAGRDRRTYHSERSSSIVENLSDSSNRHGKERHKHHQRSSKKHDEENGRCDSDSSRRSYHQTQKMDAERYWGKSDVKRDSWKHHRPSKFGLEPSKSGDWKREREEKEPNHSYRHSRHKFKSTDDQLNHDRWELVDGLDEDHREDYHHHHKRKRIH